MVYMFYIVLGGNSLRVIERERDSVCVRDIVCMRERERERDGVCVREREGEREK